jgi:uncharacterized protein YceK
MKVLNFAISKAVYILKSVEKWLCKTRKYKTVVDLPFCSLKKKLLLQYFVYELMFSNPNIQMI